MQDSDVFPAETAAAKPGGSDAGDCRPDAAGLPAGKVRLLTLDALDGRTAAAKAARSLIADIESDLGGADQLSAAEREVIQRTALSGVMLQDMEARWLTGLPIDVPAYTTLANTQSRMLKLLGLQRRARDVTPDLKTHLAQVNAQDSIDAG